MRLTAACLLLCLLAPALCAQDAGPSLNAVKADYEQIFLDPALKTGDLDAHAAKLARLIEKGSRPALREWGRIKDDVGDPKPVYAALSKLAKDDFKACGTNADDFADAYVKLARKFRTELSWQKVARERRGVTQAAYIGPFADPTAPAHDDAFSPEVMVDFDAEYDGAYGRVKWRPVKHYDDLDAELDLYSQQRWPGYGYYIATALVSDDDRDAVIKLKLAGPGKAWLDGEYLLDADSRGAQLPDEFELPVKLHRGRNLLLVKLSTVGSLRIRVRDPQGRLMPNVLAVTPKAGDPAVPVRGGKPSNPNGGTPAAMTRLDVRAELAENAKDKKACGLVMLDYANEAAARGLEDRADEAAARARDNLPDEPLVQLAFLRDIGKGRLYSGSERRKLTRSITDALLGAEPALVPAVLEKAKLLASDERYREAVDLLHGALEHTPAKWRVYLALADVFRGAGWDGERVGAVKAALKDAPASLPVLTAASACYAVEGALDREMEVDRKRLEILPGDPDASLSLAATLGHIGDPAGALKHLRILVAADPANDYLRTKLAEALANNGKLAEALKVYEQQSAESPKPEEALYRAARACLQLGRDDQGEKYLQRVVALDPGQHLARRELQRMRGESEDFWSDYAVSWDELKNHDIKASEFPRAASALILDELIQLVYSDGSSVSYVHQVRKILTQAAVDTRGKQRVPGELVTARTIKADGSVLEPITQPGGLVEFPGVEVGALLDVAYLLHADSGPQPTLDGDGYYFMDDKLAEPFAITRWVVIAPPAMPFNIVYHNLRPDDPGVSITQEQKNGMTVRTWDVRDPRMPERERFMPSSLEIMPSIECVRPRDWRARAREVAADGLRKVMDTPLIDARAAELTKGLKTPEAKARAVYAWVNEKFTTEGDAGNAHQALKAGAGDRGEVFVSLCEAAGIPLGFAAVDAAPPYKRAPDGSLPRPHWAYPDDSHFPDDFVVVRRSDGGLDWIELAERLRPYGVISTRQASAPAILWMDGEYSLTFLPGVEREKDRFENRVHIKLDADGGAKLDGSITVRGERSYAMKEQMRNTPNDELCNSLEADLSLQYKGFEVSECLFPKLGDVGEPLVQEYTGKVRKLATRTDDGLSLELPGEKLGKLLSILVGTRKREFDIVINFDLVQTDEIRISPPDGMAFKEVPEDLVYPTAPLTYSLKFRMDGADLVVTRKLVLGPGRFRPVEYNSLVEQIKRIKQAEDSTLKLKVTK